MSWTHRLSIGLPLLLFSNSAFAQPGDKGWMWDSGWGWGGMMVGGGLVMLLFWGAIIVLLIALLSRVFGADRRPPPHGQMGPSAMDVLRERYARGEIEKEEFEERRKTLGG